MPKESYKEPCYTQKRPTDIILKRDLLKHKEPCYTQKRPTDIILKKRPAETYRALLYSKETY